MSKAFKITLDVILIIIIIGGGIWWWMMSRNSESYASPAAIMNSTSSMNPDMSMQSSTPTSTSTAPVGTSDQSLNQEMTNINEQMNGFASDSASINQGLNDQPVPQGQ